MKPAKVAVLGVAAMAVAGLANAGSGYGHEHVSSGSNADHYGGRPALRHVGWSWSGSLPRWCDPGGGGIGGGGGGGVGVSATPEPGTWAMLIVGAGLVAFQLRRKQQTLGSFGH